MSRFFEGVSDSPAVTETITNVFWPDIALEPTRRVLRLGDTVSLERLSLAVQIAISSVNRELTPVRDRWILSGYARASDVPADTVGGESTIELSYRRAVLSLVGAELAERYRGSDSTANGAAHADQLSPSIDEYRRDARWAISDLLGSRRSKVELI